MQQSADRWLADAKAHHEAERRDEAAQALERALAIDPNLSTAWFRLGNVRQEQGQNQAAIGCFERVVALEPLHAKAWNNIGVSREAIGDDAGAAHAYQRAVEAAPTLTQAILNLAHLALRHNDYATADALLKRVAALDPPDPQAREVLDRAIRNARAKPLLDQAEAALARGDAATLERCCLAALEHVPGNPTFTHLLAVARGDHSAAPPEGYVSSLFDGFAERFDRSMIEVLECRIPEMLARLAVPLMPDRRPARIVDLGCGTGLLGVELAGLKAEMTGIDLSRNMLDLAARRGIYARLARGDIVEELRKFPASSTDAVLAADVFVYVGDLRAVFAEAARAMIPGGLFAFSVEAMDDGGFRLGPKGRYAHSADYLRKLAAQHGLVERRMERANLRREGDAFILGWLACFAKPA